MNSRTLSTVVAVSVALAAILLIVSPIDARRVKVQDCDSTSEIHRVKIRPCGKYTSGGKDGCLFKKGTKTKFVIKFTPTSNSTTLEQDAYGILYGLPLPWPGFGGDACPFMSRCPLVPGKRHTFKTTNFTVNPTFPSISAVAQYVLIGDNNENVVCFKFPVKLQN